MARSILEAAIRSRPDMCVVGESSNADLEQSARLASANAVILEARTREHEGWDLLSGAKLEIAVLVITDLGRGVTLHECRSTRFEDPSPDTLLDAISSALRASGTDAT